MDKLQLKKSVYKCYEPSKEYSHSRYNCLSLLEWKGSGQSSNIAWSPSLNSDVPTWTTYYSLLGVKPVVITVAMLPIINGSPAECEYLYAAVKEAEKIKNCIYKDGKTTISFISCNSTSKLLCCNKDLINPFCICVLYGKSSCSVLKVIGRLIDGSGLDQAFD